MEQPQGIRDAVSAWAGELQRVLRPGDVVVVEWMDASTERQVVKVRAEKAVTPVKSLGIFYCIERNHLIIFEHIFSNRWKDVTYIPLAWIQSLRVVEHTSIRGVLLLERSWSGNAHTRKVRISRRYAMSRTREVERCLRTLK